MQTINVQTRQSWLDLAVQCYGNVDALEILLEDNAGDDLIDIAEACGLATVQIRVGDPATNAAALRALNGQTVATLEAQGDYDDEYDEDEYD
jgi:hypothetical protein